MLLRDLWIGERALRTSGSDWINCRYLYNNTTRDIALHLLY